MAEVLEASTQDLDAVTVETFGHWEKDPDPIIAEAHQAFQRQSKKPPRLLEPNPNNQVTKEGIYNLPHFANYELLQVGQRRGLKDLFTRGRSAHDVAFGVAEIRNGSGPRLVNVAIKHFYGLEKAVVDATNNAAILDRGFSTTDPISIILDGENGFIISPVKSDVQTIDTEPWHQYSSGSEIIRRHFISRLSGIAKIAANLNSSGINHADGALRNYWVNQLGMIEPFDWESASLTTDPPTPTELINFAVGTLRPLYKSLDTPDKDEKDKDRIQTVAILKGPPGARWNEFNSLVFEDYIDQLVENFHRRGLLNDEYLEAIASVEAVLKEKLKVKDN